MLNLNNRLFYSQLLSPPEDYELDHALGTTYSLDLKALLSIPVALMYSQNLDSDFSKDRNDVLIALKQCGEKLTVFCQNGKMPVIKTYHRLFAFLEQSVFPVTTDIAESSFHPKLWVIRFKNKENHIVYRLAVLSRNLTFDQSWDMAFYGEGSPSVLNMESQKLVDYLSFFYKRTKREIPANFLNDLAKVSFSFPAEFESLKLWPILGFDKNISKFPNTLLDDEYQKMMVISPFLDKGTLEKFNANCKELKIVSRYEELQKFDKKFIDNFDCYYLNTNIVDGDSSDETHGEENLSQNLHAKVFIGQNDKTTNWFVGSANCTDPAFTRNAEFLVQLTAHSKYAVSYAKMKNDMLGDKQNIFIPFSAIDTIKEETELEPSFRNAEFALVQLKVIGSCQKREDEKYNVSLNIDLTHLNSLKDFNAGVYLFLRQETEHRQKIVFGKQNTIVFKKINLTDLSSFFIFELEKDGFINKFLLKVEIEIPEERNAFIFRKLLGTKKRFLEYLQFMLQPDTKNSFMSSIDTNLFLDNTISNSIGQLLGSNNNIYETLMQTASRSPEKLKQVNDLISDLQKTEPEMVQDILPLWETFKSFLND